MSALEKVRWNMKAILMIDNPECCGDCPLLQQYYDDEHEEWYEMCYRQNCKIKDIDSKLKDCPLIEINDNIARLIEVAR